MSRTQNIYRPGIGCRALHMAGMLLAATATQAALLVYEGFDQGDDDGPLNGLAASANDLTGTLAVNDTATAHRG